MTPEEAIKRTETFIERHPGYDYSTLIPALQLGIEALKFTLAVRGTILHYATLPLPGETKD